MRRFKRSLSTKPLPAEPVVAKVAKFSILHEGFAIRSDEIIPHREEVSIVPQERDGTEAKPYSRGSGDIAMAIASNPERCRRALLEDSMAKTSLGPIESRLRKWEAIARQAGYHDPFSLSPEPIYTVMGALKLAGYRSAEQYLETAKQERIRNGSALTDQLRQAARASIRSCRRGIGCAKQAKGLPLPRLGDIHGSSPISKGGPMNPARSTILASWWLLREIEAANSRVKHITISTLELKVTWRLPSSKADWKALGAERARKCSCRFAPSNICPYHCMLQHLEDLPTDPESPVFPGIDGKPATKAGWADTFQELATVLDLPLSHPNGARCWTGRAARVTGAMHMASSCIELWRIQIFGRWGSDAFLLYVRDAPVTQLDSLASESSAQLSIQTAQNQLKDLLRQVETAKESLNTSIALPTSGMLTDCESSPEIPPPAPTSEFCERLVKNKSHGGKVHMTQYFMPDTHPREWRTKCAWKFALHETDYEFIEAAPTSQKCLKCFPRARARSSSSTNSSSSSTNSCA